MSDNTWRPLDDGDECIVDGCDGKLEYKLTENCSCHISAPCSACTSNTALYCDECGEVYEQD
jgi:hypothetical protein